MVKVVGYRLEWGAQAKILPEDWEVPSFSSYFGGVRLGTSSQCLLLTGPNAGGKTVVLKTLGLLALLVCGSVAVVGGSICGPSSGGELFFPGLFEARCGIPIPGGEAPRVDFFEALTSNLFVLLLTTATGSRDHDVFCSASCMIHRM